MTGGGNAATVPRVSRTWRLALAFASLYIVWGSTYLAIRYAVVTIPPFVMLGTRFLISGAILYWWAVWRGNRHPSAPAWRDASITGVLLLCCGNASVAWAEQRVPSGTTALLVAVVPAWMVLLDWLRPHGVRPRLGVFLGLAMGFIGLTLLIGPAALNSGHARVDPVGVMALLAGSIAWAAGSIYNRHGVRPESAQLATGMQMLAGSVALLIVATVSGEVRHFDIHSVTRSALHRVGVPRLVTFGSLVGFTAYIYLLRETTAARASTYAYINPLVAVGLGWAVAGEPVSSSVPCWPPSLS